MTARTTMDLPYAYHVTFVVPGGSVERTERVRGTASFELASVSGRDAPLGAWVGKVATRTHEGGSFGLLGGGLEAAGKLGTLLRHAKMPDREWKAFGLPRLPIFGARRSSPCDPRTEDEVVAAATDGRTRGTFRRLRDDRDRRIAEAQETYGRELLLVDGILHVASPEPHYLVEIERGRVVLRAGAEPGTRAEASYLFRADHREEAEAFARELSDRWRRPVRDEGLHVSHAPDLLTLDERAILADRIGRRLRSADGTSGSMGDVSVEARDDRWVELVLGDRDLRRTTLATEDRGPGGDRAWHRWADLWSAWDVVSHAYPSVEADDEAALAVP